MANENLVFLREARDLLRKGLDKLDKLSTYRVGAMRETDEADLSILREIEAQGEETRAGLKMLLRELARGELEEGGILTVARALNLPNEDGYLCEAHRLSLRRIGAYLRDKEIRERMQGDLRQMYESIAKLEENEWRNNIPRAAKWAENSGFHVTPEAGTGVFVATLALPADDGVQLRLELAGGTMRMSLHPLHGPGLLTPIVYRDLSDLYKQAEKLPESERTEEFRRFLLYVMRSEVGHRGALDPSSVKYSRLLSYLGKRWNHEEVPR